MITNYVGSSDSEHHVTEYTLSTGKVVTLTEEEADELCQFIDKTNYAKLVESLEVEVESLDEENSSLHQEVDELQKQVNKLLGANKSIPSNPGVCVRYNTSLDRLAEIFNSLNARANPSIMINIRKLSACNIALSVVINNTIYNVLVADYTDPESLEKYLRDLLGSHTYSLNVLDK